MDSHEQYTHLDDMEGGQDQGLTAEQLDCKYNLEGEGEHPIYLRSDWRACVHQRDTLRGYWDWVVSQVETQSDLD